MANESLLITMLPDGTFHVKETEPAGEAGSTDPAIDQSVSSADEVTQLVQQWLSSEADEGEDAADGGADEASEGEAPPDANANGAPAPAQDPQAMKSAWNQEAATRDASGYRK
jgi:hypothetical protein